MKEIYIKHGNSISLKDIDTISFNTNSTIVVLDTITDSDTTRKYPFLKNANFVQISMKKKKYPIIDKNAPIFINIDSNTTSNQLTNVFHILKNSNIIFPGKSFIGWISQEINSDFFHDFIICLQTLTYDTLEAQYNYLYDIVCDRLDKEFKEKNFCDFKEDKCIANRKNKSSHELMGCCYSFQYSKSLTKFIENEHLCEYLKDRSCSVKCISCKMFTCQYLRKKGINFNSKNIFIVNTFFNRKQQETIEKNLFVPKEKIINKLILDLKNKEPYFIYYLKNSACISNID